MMFQTSMAPGRKSSDIWDRFERSKKMATPGGGQPVKYAEVVWKVYQNG